MKKSMIALTALLISAVILCFSQAGATGSADETTVPTTLPSIESSEESTAAEDNTENLAAESSESSSAAAAQAQTTAESSPHTVTGATTSSTTSTARTTTTKPAVNIAPAVPTPATAAQTTTTTRYVPPQTAATTTTTRYVAPMTTAATTARTTTTARSTTSTTTARATTTTTRATTTTMQPKADYEAMGQARYQEEAIKALNVLRAERGQPAMTINTTLMANSLTHAQAMAAVGREYHSTTNLPGCESVCRVPINFPAALLGETLGKHTPQFLESSRSTVGIAVVRQGNYLYAVMQGS